MKITPIQTTFLAGELSPRFLSRSDTPGYQSGCITLQNMNVLMHGPARSRPGLEFILPIEANDNEFGRMFPFPLSQTQSFLIVVSDNDLIVVDAITGLQIKRFVSVFVDAPDLADMQAKFSPNGGDLTDSDEGFRLIFTLQSLFPRQIRLDPTLSFLDEDAWVFEVVDFNGTEPPEWFGGNNPCCMTWFQGRTYWAGTPGQPTQFWASKSNDFYDLTTGVTAEDGFTESIARNGAIRWMESSRNILIGTEFDEFILSSFDGVIEPSNPIEIQRQSSNGSDLRQGLTLGNKVLYVSGDGHKLYSIDYSWNEQSYLTRDITFQAEHFKDLGRINYLSFQKNPESFIWMTTDTGLMFSCTYDPENGVTGWAEHNTKGNKFLDVATIELNGTSDTWVLVSRDPGVLNIEKMQENYFMDAVQVVELQAPSNQFEVDGRFIGTTVQVINDGAVENDVVVQPAQIGFNGVVTVDNDGLVFGVGFQYDSILETMPVDKGASGGSAMEMNKRWNRIFVRLIDSALPLINGTRPPDRDPSTPLGERNPNATQDAEVRDLGWSLYGTVTVTMDIPLNMTVSGIFGELNQKRVG